MFQNLISYQINIKFPTEHNKHSINILNRSHQWQIMRYVQSHFTFKNPCILNAEIRIKKIYRLTWNDLDIKNGVIHIRKTIQRIDIVEATKNISR